MVQRGPPHNLTKTVKFEHDLCLIRAGVEMVLKNSVLIPHPLLSVQSSKENHISGVELWRNGPFRGELPGCGFGGFPVRSSIAFMQNRAKLHENVHIKVRAPSP